MENLPVRKAEEGLAELEPVDGNADHVDSSIAEKRFDASQYAFFGRDVKHEIEIGGLDEEDYAEQEEVLEDEGEENSFEERKGRVNSSYAGASHSGEVSELAYAFMPSNTPSSEEASTGNLDTTQKPNSAKGVTDLSGNFEPIPCNWLDLENQEGPVRHVGEKWWPSTESKSSSELGLVVSLRPSPLQGYHQEWQGGELSSVQAVPAAPMYRSTQHIELALGYVPPSEQLLGRVLSGPVPGQYGPPYYSVQAPMGVASSVTSSAVTFPSQYSSSASVTPLAPPAQWIAQSNVQHGSVSGSCPEPFYLHSSLLPPQVVLQYQLTQGPQLHNIPPSYPHLKPQRKYHATPLAPQTAMRIGENLPFEDMRDLFPPRGRPAQRQHQYGPGDGQLSFRNTHNNGWQPLRSKYMTVEEIENIVRIQWAATHSSDPYVEDYYHQAMQTKLSRGSPQGRRHFAPSHLRELPSHTRAAVEPHAYLQVDALGRVPFSSIRRPRPLLEVDSGQASGGPLVRGQGDFLVDGVSQYRPLEQEPMLAARIAIEEGLCLLLDVDDIDRLLATSQPPDGGAQLRRRRQLLVEGLAASFHLGGNNGDDAGMFGINGGFTVLANKDDDLLVLRLLSLSKGRKLLTRYLQLLTRGSELIQSVAVTIFRHLRFLFGGAQADSSSSATIVGLANATAVSVSSLDLSGLSACLAAILSAPEQPPLRPMGSPAGDGATLVLRAVLERATSLLTDKNTTYPLHNRAVWQASFDEFFALLTKYCTNKYDSIFHSLMMASSNNSLAVNATAAATMSKEMPVELLRASLPHTSDHQRSILLEFTQRSMSTGPFPPNPITEDHASTGTARA